MKHCTLVPKGRTLSTLIELTPQDLGISRGATFDNNMQYIFCAGNHGSYYNIYAPHIHGAGCFTEDDEIGIYVADKILNWFIKLDFFPQSDEEIIILRGTGGLFKFLVLQIS